ncbi:glycosyltransferase [Massilia jejuensis]|uniref:Glycosyltransferase n=1 Tax=Massilia jejuensis TaxID=648894 RepID=A0ABW0PBV4_9BURK
MKIGEVFYRWYQSGLSEVATSAFLETLVLALLVSLAACSLNVITERWHGRFSFDLDVKGVQKVHKHVVSRTGGIAIMCGVLSVPLLAKFEYFPSTVQMETRTALFKLLVAAMPAFLAGVIEDITKKVSVRTRFCSILASALLAAWLLEAYLPRLDVWGLDGILTVVPISLAITAFAVVGVTNSINIVDGFNGVAGATIVIILGGAAYLTWSAGDVLVTQLALAGIGATFGFLLLNYPTGRLFMGDGGAYFMGFWTAEVAVLAVVRNPEINAWQILAIYAYPVIEVVFSMYRRRMLRDAFVGAPDRLHLHSLFYRRIACHRISIKKYSWIRNAGVAWFVAAWLGIATVAAISFARTIPAAVALVLLQVLLYIAVYMRLVRGNWGRCRSLAVVLGLRPQQRSRSI